MAEIDFEIFDGKKYSDLCKDIYINSTHKRDQIDILISDLRSLVKSTQDALLIVPLIKEYMDVSVKNDEHLVKLAAIFQRFNKSINSESDSNYSLTDEEKNQLMREVECELRNIRDENFAVENIKKNSKNILQTIQNENSESE